MGNKRGLNQWIPSLWKAMMYILLWIMEGYLWYFKCQKKVTKQYGHYDLIFASGIMHTKLLLITISGWGVEVVFIPSSFACLYFLMIILKNVRSLFNGYKSNAAVEWGQASESEAERRGNTGPYTISSPNSASQPPLTSTVMMCITYQQGVHIFSLTRRENRYNQTPR